MRYSTSEDIPFFKHEIPGMLIFFIVTVGSLYLGHHFKEPVMQYFGLGGDKPRDEPPWYFINRDFAEGICSLGALSLSLVVAAITWRRWPNYSGMMVWMSLIWQGGSIAQSWIIYRSCPGLLNGQRICGRWPTFDSYLHDAQIDRARTLVLTGALIVAAVLPLADRLIRRSRKLTSNSVNDA